MEIGYFGKRKATEASPSVAFQIRKSSNVSLCGDISLTARLGLLDHVGFSCEMDAVQGIRLRLIQIHFTGRIDGDRPAEGEDVLGERGKHEPRVRDRIHVHRIKGLTVDGGLLREGRVGCIKI